MGSTAQILLPLEGRRADRFEEFVHGPNGAVIAALEEFLSSGEGGIFLRGAQGSGKTHLLNAAFNRASDYGLQAFYISLATLPEAAAQGLAGLEQMDLVCVDDVDLAAGKPVWEKALFHFFNRFRAQRGRLLVSSSTPLSSVPFELPDLASRLAWGLRLQLEALDDADKLEILHGRAAALGFKLPEDVAQYLLSRSSRSMSALMDNFEAIRLAALQAKRKITIPLAREILLAQ